MSALTPNAVEIPPNWWESAVVYQIYPRSFADDDGDGIGDLAGIASRVPYLSELGVDAVWLSPFYPSALADGGYDVDNYRDVDPRLGTLAIFDELVSGLHSAGMKIMVDVVPNHTSNRHPWFVEALGAPIGSAARDRYIFRDGLGPGGATAPNDWQSLFGGSCWQPVGDGQWYLHLFAAEQPDLNWQNPEVRADFETTLRFWADRGVDGFSGSTSRTVWSKTWPSPSCRGARSSTCCVPTARIRSGTATTCIRSMPPGGPSSTPTIRP